MYFMRDFLRQLLSLSYNSESALLSECVQCELQSVLAYLAVFTALTL